MYLPLPIRRSRELGIMEHDESIVTRHMDVCFDPVGAISASFGEGGEGIFRCEKREGQ
jgi:hypothetical protein